MYIKKVFYFYIKNIFVFIHLKAKTLKAPFETFVKNICKNISKVAFRVVLAMVYKYKYVLKLKINNFVFINENHQTPPRG